MEGEKYDPRTVWRHTWRRFERKAAALAEVVANVRRRADSRGDEPPDLSPRSAPLTPIARFSPEGELIWDNNIVKEIKLLFEEKV